MTFKHACTFLIIGTTLWANGTRLPNQDARATARGNAFVATADNASAIYYNPAGITQTEGSQLLAGLYVFRPETDYVSPTGATASLRSETFTLPQLYYTHRGEDSRWAWGLGLYSPWGQSSDWGTTGPFATLATRNEIQFITASAAAAYQLSENLSVGVTVQANDVEADLRQAIGFSPGDQLRFEGDDSSFAGSIGILWEAAEEHVFGMTYQSHTTVNYDGTIEQRPYAPVTDARAEMPFPDFFALAYSYRPTPQWNFEFGIDWTNWERLNTVTVNYPGPPVAVVFEWESSFYYLFGATYREGPWAFHGGYIFSENSVPDNVFNPSVADSDRHLFSIGAEYQQGGWDLTFVLQLTPEGSRTVTGSPRSVVGQSADGRYSTSIFGGALSAAYNF
ncbi:MAG: outer membrane protein transport protein [Synoicihabitans sp.]